MIILEDRRNELISKSKRGKKEKDGLSRYEKRTRSRVANTVRSFNEIDMDQLFRKNILTVSIPVTGETDDYLVTISFGSVLDEIQREIKKNNDKLELKSILRALMNAFNSDNVYIRCNCPDSCLHESTKIKLLNGQSVTMSQLLDKYNNGEELWTYSVDDNGDFKPGQITDVWISGQAQTFIEITLDNDQKLLTTNNHLYMLRDGSYIRADELQTNMSLMPLYFSYHNGYECVKQNSYTRVSKFYSVYKIVADELLQMQIDEAKLRSGEQNIVIHHIDYNKLNNYPSNLKPMGVQEHWMFHCQHIKETGVLQKWLDGGERYRQLVMDHTTPEYRKQADVAKRAFASYYDKYTKEEIHNIREQMGCYSDEWRQKIGDANRQLWLNADDDYRNWRRSIIVQNNARPEVREKLSQKQKQKYIDHPERKEICKQNLKIAQERIKGSKFTEEHKNKISQSRLNRTDEQVQAAVRKDADTKILKVLNYMLSNNIDITFDNYDECKKLKQFKVGGIPKLSKYFQNIDDVIIYYSLNNKYNHKIKAIRTIVLDDEVPIYDLTVDKYNNFLTDAGVILHNCFRFAYWQSVSDIITGPKESRPAKITNPNNDLGPCCKHTALVLSNTSFLIKVASVINNYIHWFEKNRKKQYADIIYPAVFGKKYEEPVQLSIDDKDTLDTSKSDIDTSNEYGRTRTQFKPGNTYRYQKKLKPDPNQTQLDDIDDKESEE